MARTMADLAKDYEDAYAYWDTVDANTRDWGGTYDQPSRDAAGGALARAEEALVAALAVVGPVTYRDLWLRQYRVVGDSTQAR